MGLVEFENKPQLLHEEDIPSLMRLEEEAFPIDHWSEDSMRKEFRENPEGFRLLKTAQGIVLAYIQFQIGYDRLDITGPKEDGVVASLAVLQAEQREGLGKLLMNTAVDCLRVQGVSRIILHTRESNFALINLCAGLGFRTAGEIQNYYQGGEKAIELVLPNRDK